MIYESFKIHNLLRNMQNLTSLVVSMTHSDLLVTHDGDLHFPALRTLDLSGMHAMPGLLLFTVRHSMLHTLRLEFETWMLSSDEWRIDYNVLEHNLLELRALNINADCLLFRTCFLGRRGESATTTRARRPHLEHLRITNIRLRHFLVFGLKPFTKFLRRLDLHFVWRNIAFEGWFTTYMENFTALVELSITIKHTKQQSDDEVVPQDHHPVLTEDVLVCNLLKSTSN